MGKCLELIEEQYEVKFRDTKYMLRCPTQLELLDFSEKYEAIEGNRKKFDSIVDYFDSLGFPKAVGKDLSSGHLEKLLTLFDGKKN